MDEKIVKKGIDFDKKAIKKNLTLFLYPDDSDKDGNLLRIYQEYFMTANAARLILKTLGLRKGGIDVVSCPTCGRTKIDLISLAQKVEKIAEDYPYDIKLAVMGCAVNGPGEAREADLGIAGGLHEGLLMKRGEIVRKVPEAELLNALKEELDNWGKE